jgi:hypothetical protein
VSPEYASIVSTIALVVSFGSFGVAAFNSFRDRPRLKVTSNFYDVSEFGSPRRIQVEVVNRGRRPVILRLLGGYTKGGDWSGTFFDYKKGGLRLGEHERHEFTIVQEDAVHSGPEGPEETFDRMWIEDTLGNRHPIPKSGEYIAKLFS